MAIFPDTHQIHSQLVKAGFEQEKADVIVGIFRDANTQVATKSDIEIAEKRLESNLIKWMVGLHIASVGIIITLLLSVLGR